jgi:hypothetical protein
MDLKSEKVKSLLTAIRSGTDLDTSCHFAGLSINDVYKWLERGKIEAESISSGNPPKDEQADFYEFWTEMAKSRANAIVRNVSSIQKAAQDGQWQAAAWWLERTAPDQYAKKQPGQLNQEVKQLPQILGKE